MFEQKILALQDYLLTQNKEDLHTGFEYSFEEIETDTQTADPRLVVSRFYESAYYAGLSDHHLLALTEMLLELEEQVGWHHTIRLLCQKYGLDEQADHIKNLALDIFGQDCEAWLVTPQPPKFEEESPEIFQSDLESYPPLDSNWQDILFRWRHRYFLLHFGKTL